MAGGPGSGSALTGSLAGGPGKALIGGGPGNVPGTQTTGCVAGGPGNAPTAAGSGPGGGPVPGGQTLTTRHADATGTGFSAAAAAQEAAAMRAQGVEAKVETIRRDQPKVGRNDPCPCGSGKKYKQCHGKN